MIKENLYLFLPYTGSNISIYTNNKQIYTIAQHSSSRNNTFYVMKGAKKQKFALYIHQQNVLFFKKLTFTIYGRNPKHGLNITLKSMENCMRLFALFLVIV